MPFYAEPFIRFALARRKRARKRRNEKYRNQKNHCAGKEFMPKIRIHGVPPFLRRLGFKEFFPWC
jgi:hypothetical protein